MQVIKGLSTALLVFLLDQITKALVSLYIPPYKSVSIWGIYIKLTHVRNPNSIFGISLGSHFPYFWVSLVAALILFVLLFFERRTRYILIYGAILGGALGNALDRLRWGEVLDFVDIGINENLRWAVFNVADASITISLIVLLFFTIMERKEKIRSTDKEV
jgi:signal peptidase II